MKIIRQSTKDYNIFQFKEDNRDTKDSKAHIRDIAESMKRNGFIESRAILVKRIPGSYKLLVLDGQHRVLAAQIAQVSIWYEIDDTIPDTALPDLQISKAWLPKDYLKHFVVNKNDNFVKLKMLHDMYPHVSITTIVLLLIDPSNWGGYRKKYESGIIEIVNLENAQKTLKLMDELYKLRKGAGLTHDWLTGRTFLTEFADIINLPDFEFKILTHKVKERSEAFTQMMSPLGYWEMFDRVYNYLLRTNRVDFTYKPRVKRKGGRPKTQDEGKEDQNQ